MNEDSIKSNSMAQQTEAKKKNMHTHTTHLYTERKLHELYQKKKKIYRLSFDQQCDILALGKKKCWKIRKLDEKN